MALGMACGGATTGEPVGLWLRYNLSVAPLIHQKMCVIGILIHLDDRKMREQDEWPLHRRPDS